MRIKNENVFIGLFTLKMANTTDSSFNYFFIIKPRKRLPKKKKLVHLELPSVGHVVLNMPLLG